jgi:hypothetical protein
MDVKELVYDNVRGRVRELIWRNVVMDVDRMEAELNPDDAGKIRLLYERTKYWYGQFEPLLKEMESDEKEAAN